MSRPWLISRRLYYITKAMMFGADMFTALEAVNSTAIEHPEWDMDERRSWEEWESSTSTRAQ